MKNHGTDFLGDIGPKKSINLAKPKVDFDAIEQLMESSSKDAKRLHDGLSNAAADLEAIKKSGLTGAALVVLVTEKCGTYTTAGGRSARPGPEVVLVVLEALFRLGEYVR